MGNALFVNSSDQFFAKSSEDLGDANLVTQSFVQASLWLRDESIPISAIYLNPNDMNHSALQFLGETLWARPVTPVFILDEAGDLPPQNFSSLSEQFKINGTFSGKVSSQDLLAPLQIEVPENLLALSHRFYIESDHFGYLAVPLIDFIYAKKYPANIFVEDEASQLRLFGTEGDAVDLEYLSFLAKSSAWLYIPETAIEARMNAFRTIESSYLDPKFLSPSWRTAEVFVRAKRLLANIKTSSMDSSVLQQTYTVLQDVFELASQFSEESELSDLVEKAKQCDRAIAAVTFSVLLCKKMKYATGSTITKTLGFASLLQDVSLYQSPFGDLSGSDPNALSGEAFSYYMKHPHHSAEILKISGNIPELALQVIRQQHERPDRSGFPDQVGGAQLHRLSEILSLINSYLDPRGDADFVNHYSKDLVSTFQQVIKMNRVHI